MEGSFELAEKKIAEVEDAFDKIPDKENFSLRTIRGLINSHKAYLAFVRGNLDEAVSISKASLSQLPDNMIVIRTLTLLYLGLSLRFQGKLKESLAIYRDTSLYGKQLVGSSIAVFCYLHLSDLYYDLGELQKSLEMAEDAIQTTLFHTGGLVPPFLGYAYICIGRVLRQWGRLSEALDMMQTGINLCYQWNVADVMAKGNNELADLYFSLGEKESSQEALQESRLIYQGFSQWASGLVSAHQVKHNLGFGELGDASLWIQGLKIELGNRIDLSRDSEYLTLARVYISQNRFDESLSVLEKIIKASQKAEKIKTLLESLILQARVFFLLKSEDMAAEKLQQSLVMGQEKGYVQIFVDEGLEMKVLLEGFYSQDKRIINYVDTLLAAFKAEETTASPTQTLIDPLSEREIEVLEQISKGLTNQEIGSKLFITLNTVKAHTRNIYSKLAVNNRTQAVAQARSFGILVEE
jgi:LuxR family maltose regulon positive regulatory protein